MRSVVIAVVVACVACSPARSAEADRGAELMAELGCEVCHGAGDGIGPSLSGRWGSTRELADGSTVIFDDDYVHRSIASPTAQIVAGFDPVMPSFSLAEDDLNAITAFMRVAE